MASVPSESPSHAVTASTAVAARPPGDRPGRITSLDLARGAFLIASVTTSAVLPPRPAQLVHAQWSGVTLYDLIFPLFVTLSGVGLAFAYKNRTPWLVTARRVVVLLVVGLLYNGLASGDFTLETFRVTEPLQVYAVLVLVVAVSHRWLRTAAAWLVATVLSAALLAGALRLWARTCADGVLTPECNPSGAIDTFLLGPHMYAGGSLGHDPEGVVGIAGAFVTACVGITAGHLSVRFRHSRSAAPRLLGWALTVTLLGLVLATMVDPMKRLWTPSFGLLTGGLGALIFAVGFLLLDVPAGARWERWRTSLAWPFVALGRNSLLVYFGSHLTFDILARSGGDPSWARRTADVVAFGADPRVAFVLGWLVLWWLLSCVLHRYRLYVHA